MDFVYPESLGPAFREAWQKLDYRALAGLRALARTDLERYLTVRGLVVTGDYDGAQGVLAEQAARFTVPFYVTFLRLQLRVYRQQNLAEAAGDLSGLTGIPETEAIRGEFHFVLGYLHQLLSEIKQGSRHHRLARESYLAAGLPACAAVAVFNLCLGSNYLNARSLLLEQTRDLASLVEQAGHRQLRALSAQWAAYEALEREDYATAEREFREVLSISRADGRRREVGTAAWLLAYVYARQGADAAFDELLSELGAGFGELTEEYQVVLRETARLVHAPLLSAEDARPTLRRWRRLRIDPLHTSFLTELLVEKLDRAQAYEAVLTTCRRARRQMLQQQQALALVDLRFTEARALAKLGEIEKARRTLFAYRADNLERGASARAAKADELAKQLTRADGADASLRICPLTQTLIVGTRRICLESQPKVFQLLRALAEERRAVPAARLFLRIYGLEYHPLRHERRLSSLLERARRAIGSTDAIRRADGVVSWAPWVTAQLESPPTTELLLQWRRQQLLRKIREAGRPLTISELERGFAVSRRTLQLDLEHFLRAGDVCTNGGTRRRTYFMKEERHAVSA